MSDTSTSLRQNLGNRTEHRGRGRLHQPTDASRKQVEALASFGVPRNEIAMVATRIISILILVDHNGPTPSRRRTGPVSTLRLRRTEHEEEFRALQITDRIPAEQFGVMVTGANFEPHLR